MRVLFALCLLLAPLTASAQATDENINKVIAVFLAHECLLTPDSGAATATESGLTTEDFSAAMSVLEKDHRVTINKATFEFRLNHEDCP